LIEIEIKNSQVHNSNALMHAIIEVINNRDLFLRVHGLRHQSV